MALALIGISRGRIRNLVILALSLIFYYWSSGLLTGLILFSIGFNYAVGRMLDGERRQWIVGTGITVNLALLVYFKYAWFIADNVDRFTGAASADLFSAIILPVGISFFTFQSISYLIDIYRRDVEPEQDLIRFGAYLSFFPQLIAGPIVRYADVIEDYTRPKVSAEAFGGGAMRFAHGLAKKIIVADSAGAIADACFAQANGDITSGVAWLGAIAYTIQIYFDFSAYSDMAIGIASMCGIRLLENFRHPYTASTITEFWRRWHISLSSWFRDYLYIPLGGSRVSTVKVYRNLMIVFLTTGVWHGAAWTFVLWGVFHGVFLILERIFFKGRAADVSSLELRFFYMAPVVIVGWVLFRAEDLSQAMTFYQAMILIGQENAWSLPFAVRETLTPFLGFALLVGCSSFLMRPDPSFGAWLTQPVRWQLEISRLALVVPPFLVALALALSQNYSPFLYFRF